MQPIKILNEIGFHLFWITVAFWIIYSATQLLGKYLEKKTHDDD